MVGFMMSYMQYIATQEQTDEPVHIAPIMHSNSPAYGGNQAHPPPLNLLLAGYSFGALVLARVPSVTSTQRRIEAAEKGSSAAEIFLRARTLARQTLEDQQRPSCSGNPKSPNGPRSRAATVTVGGDEHERRNSREAKRSADIVRDLPHRIKTHIHRRSGSDRIGRPATGVQETMDPTKPHTAGPAISVSFLLISPVLLPMSTTLAPPGVLSLSLGLRKTVAEDVPGFSLHDSPALVVFGSNDNFTSSKKLCQWAEKLKRQAPEQIIWSQIEGAGHFWRETGAMRALRKTMKGWVAAGVV